MNTRFVLAAYATKQTSFLVANRASAFYILFFFAQTFRVISTYQNLMCSAQLKSLLVFLKIPNDIF